VLSNKSY